MRPHSCGMLRSSANPGTYRVSFYTARMSRRFLVTGGAGFIGSNFIRDLLTADPSASILNLDCLTYAGVRATVDELDSFSGHEFVQGDISDGALVEKLVQDVDVVVHFAAETHVDRSITGPAPFLTSNVVGTGVLIDAAMKADVPKFVHVSTDEVYGSVPDGFPKEDAPVDPSSPYSASKAAAELLVKSYATTYGYQSIITRCSNNYGPYQFPEKLIPLFVTRLLDGQTVPLYGDGLNERDWIHVSDHCAALRLLADIGTAGETYNIGADVQITNLQLTNRILEAMGVDSSFIEHVPDRLGHDRRYALDSGKLRSLGWAPLRMLDDHLAGTIDWYRRRSDWWRPLVGGRA